MHIIGYKSVSLKSFQSEVQRKYAQYRETKTEIDVCLFIKAKSPQTVRNAFRDDIQIVSDEIMTKVVKCLGVDGFILWEGGVRYYFIKSRR